MKTQALSILSRHFVQSLTSELLGLLLDKLDSSISENEWMRIFARCIGADCLIDEEKQIVVCSSIDTIWRARVIPNFNPFNVHHTDVEWELDEVECGQPIDPSVVSMGGGTRFYSPLQRLQNVRAVSATPSTCLKKHDIDCKQNDNDLAAEIGKKLLDSWNLQVEKMRGCFSSVRAVVLLKGEGLSVTSVYEEDLVPFLPENYYWQWDEQDNIEGYESDTNIRRFSWMPHASRFTVVSNVPEKRLKLRINRPPVISQSDLLDSIAHDDSWIEIVP